MILNLEGEPAALLKTLLKSKELLCEQKDSAAFVTPLNELIDGVIDYMESEKYRASAVEHARLVAKALLHMGAQAAGEAIGVAPATAIEQARVRALGFPGADEAAAKLHQIDLVVDENATFASSPQGAWVSAWIFLPVRAEAADS